MKTLKITGMALGLATLASCGGGSSLDDATKDAIAAFDSSWNVALNDANQWVTDAKAERDEWEASHANVDSTAPAACQTLVADADAMIASAEESIASWEADGSWGDWKKSADDGDASQEQADSALAAWTPKLGAATMAMGDWAAQWATMKANHETAHATM